jgi:dTDP-4-dehydrorhamnose reductase
MSITIIGGTGFVGGTLNRQRPSTFSYNSQNSDEAKLVSHGLLYFSAARAEKWRANSKPDVDRAHVDGLIELAQQLQAEKVVLISTVDVFGVPRDVTENSPVVREGLHAYGAHRHDLEVAVREAHPTALIVRLPALFGTGLKKNVIFDLLNSNNLSAIHPNSSYQYYNLERLADDVDTAIAADIRLLHLTSEPLTADRIARECFGMELEVPPQAVVGRYDIQTRYAELTRGPSPYGYSSESILTELKQFILSMNGRLAT